MEIKAKNWQILIQMRKVVCMVFHRVLFLGLQACEIRDPQGKNRGHENVRERCTVRLLVYFRLCAMTNMTCNASLRSSVGAITNTSC